MPYDLPLPRQLEKLWKIRIWDRELRYEEPHVTIFRKSVHWRWGLRRGEFLDPRPDPRRVPGKILDLIHGNHGELCRQWNSLYPTNPVAREVDDQ